MEKRATAKFTNLRGTTGLESLWKGTSTKEMVLAPYDEKGPAAPGKGANARQGHSGSGISPYRIGLVDDAVSHAATEGIADRIAVRIKAVRCDFRRANHPLAQVLNKLVSRFGVTLAGEIADDGTRRS